MEHQTAESESDSRNRSTEMNPDSNPGSPEFNHSDFKSPELYLLLDVSAEELSPYPRHLQHVMDSVQCEN